LDQFETFLYNNYTDFEAGKTVKDPNPGKLYRIRIHNNGSGPDTTLKSYGCLFLYQLIYHETEKPSLSPLYLLMSARSCLSSCVRSGKVAARLPSSLTDIFIMASASQQHTSKHKLAFINSVWALNQHFRKNQPEMFVLIPNLAQTQRHWFQ
jgi:hypothetical protein